MKFASWEALGIDAARGGLLAACAGAAVGALVLVIGSVLLGPVSFVLACLTGGASVYIVASAPKRLLSRTAFLQALEAPSLAASASIYLKSTGSRSGTLLLIRGDEGYLKAALRDARRMTLLGIDSSGLDWAKEKIVSQSVAAVLASISRIDKVRSGDGSEELEGILSAADLYEETRLPMFIAVSFFLPIMLMLFAAMTHNTGFVALGGLAIIEVVILDIALSVSSNSQGWRKQ